MPRRFTGDRLVIASHNPGKVREIADLLRPFVPDCPSAATFDVPEPEETEPTFTGNARLKALHTAVATRLPALADDSGLAVDALDGAPGVLSARWAERPEGGRDFGHAMEKVERALAARGGGSRAAHFICVLALAWPDGHVETAEGRVDGTLVWPPRGERGFGYDPIFLPEGAALTFGEMDPDAKHAVSHRARAFALLIRQCLS